MELESYRILSIAMGDLSGFPWADATANGEENWEANGEADAEAIPAEFPKEIQSANAEGKPETFPSANSSTYAVQTATTMTQVRMKIF